VIAEIAKRNALLGFPSQLYFWRNRSQSEVDLVVKEGSNLRAFEVKWTRGRVAGRAFREAYGTEVETIHPENPFETDIFRKTS
jgi:predicted AAA+ superfamily ATPase